MADEKYQGTYHLAQYPNAYEPVRTNNFRFIADEKLNDLITFKESISQSEYITDNHQEVLDFSVVSFTPPHFKQEPITVSRGNSKRYFAGVPTWDEGSLVINDFAGADGKSILMAWQALSYDIENDAIPSADNYKVDATVIEYTAAHEAIHAWKLEGCWITGISEDGWNNESSDKKKVTASIRYDRAYPTSI